MLKALILADTTMSTLIPSFATHPVDALLEMGAYEYLWQQPSTTTKRLAELFVSHPDQRPSDLVDREDAERSAQEVIAHFKKRGVGSYEVVLNGSSNYPAGLRDAKDPIELFYYQGALDLLRTPRRVAVVGTRNVSHEGAARTRRLVRELVKHEFTVVSGLAQGVDTMAHKTAIESGGKTIAVIGTPISEFYPRENVDLQRLIASEFLVVSQVPVLRYKSQTPQWNRLFFPERNKTMSALTNATIIVEAGETSGTLIQAKAALEQKRKLFILESNFYNPAISWPEKYERLGAKRVRDFDDILRELT
jgi:DNA processing protein